MHQAASSPLPSPENQPGALEGIRVLELGSLLAGPFAGRILADMGAEVIKVEAPGEGDALRQWGQKKKDGASLWWPIQSRNKKCITLNLRTPVGQEIARQLIAESDIVLENFRPGTLEGWNLGYERLRALNPRLILTRISGFGQTGPYRDRVGFGSVAEAMGGLRFITGFPDHPPTRVGISIGDELAGLWAVIGTLAALQHRHATGEGQMVDTAIYESVFAMLESALPEYLLLGYIRERSGNILPGIAPTNIYPTRDGSWLVIGANTDAVFGRLAQAMGAPELADDPRYHTHDARGAHIADLDERISAWTRQHDAQELTRRLNAAGVPAGPIYSIADIVRDPHYQAREMLLNVPHPTLGNVPMPGIVPKLSATPGAVHWPGPELGAHNHEIYVGMLGMNETRLAELQQQGII